MKQCLKKDQPQETNNQATDIQQKVPSIMNGKKNTYTHQGVSP